MDKWEKEKKEQVNEVGALYSHVNNEEMKRRIFGRNEGRANDNEETIAKRLATIGIINIIFGQYDKTSFTFLSQKL